jgi:3-hydroxy-3-methylglutaryl CoA synthase
MGKFVKKVASKLLPDKLEREASRIVRQADENLKDAERDIKRTLAETEDVLTGKTPDSVAAEMREAEAAQAEALKEQEAEIEKKEERRSTAVGKRVASRRRARRAGRRSLLSGGRLSTGADQPTQRTLG